MKKSNIETLVAFLLLLPAVSVFLHQHGPADHFLRKLRRSFTGLDCKIFYMTGWSGIR